MELENDRKKENTTKLDIKDDTIALDTLRKYLLYIIM